MKLEALSLVILASVIMVFSHVIFVVAFTASGIRFEIPGQVSNGFVLLIWVVTIMAMVVVAYLYMLAGRMHQTLAAIPGASKPSG